jgi:hypothetical protein
VFVPHVLKHLSSDASKQGSKDVSHLFLIIVLCK